MDISDLELRALVRDVVARRLRAEHLQVGVQTAQAGEPTMELHVSHRRLTRLTSADADGFCLIEPAVRCAHCGYCLSLGH